MTQQLSRGRPKLDPSLPKYVRKSKGRFVYRPYDKQTKKPGKEVVLCAGSSTYATVWVKYEALIKPKCNSFKFLIREYLDSENFKKLADQTKTSYKKHSKQILNHSLIGGGTFGNLSLEVISPGVIRKYLDRRASTPTTANHELSFMSTVFSWGYERDRVSMNPCLRIKKFSVPPRRRYVTDKEYQIIYDMAPPYFKAAMELAYLCRLRAGEVINMKRDQIKPNGVVAKRSKGSKDTINLWSPRLRAAVDWDQSNIGSMYVIHNKRGQQIKYDNLKDQCRRLMKKANKLYGMESFTFHDLKAKGITDDKGDKQKGSGHKSAAVMEKHYNIQQELDEVESVR